METVVLLNRQTYENEMYDEDVFVFWDWCATPDEGNRVLGGFDVPWDHLLTFQLLVREARKDEL